MKQQVASLSSSKSSPLALAGAGVLAIGLFLLIPLTQWLQSKKDDTLLVRQMITLGPPPSQLPAPPEVTRPLEEPPPPDFEEPVETLEIAQLAVSVKATVEDTLAMEPEMDSLQIDVAASIQEVFSFADLPGGPQVVSTPRVNFPRALVRRGVKEGKVVMTIIIHENGRTTVENVVSASHPELVPEALRIAKGTIFTPPEVDGKRVKVIGEWPLGFRTK